jgi:hypothetical protein
VPISMSRTRELELRTAIADDLQAAIDRSEEAAHPEFIAGIEYATAVVLLAVDARPHDIR